LAGKGGERKREKRPFTHSRARARQGVGGSEFAFTEPVEAEVVNADLKGILG
jgi:hypothetical protein